MHLAAILSEDEIRAAEELAVKLRYLSENLSNGLVRLSNQKGISGRLNRKTVAADLFDAATLLDKLRCGRSCRLSQKESK